MLVQSELMSATKWRGRQEVPPGHLCPHRHSLPTVSIPHQAATYLSRVNLRHDHRNPQLTGEVTRWCPAVSLDKWIIHDTNPPR